MNAMRHIPLSHLAFVALCGLLAGCEAMPIGTFDRPQYVADAAQAQHDLYFQPYSPMLIPGEAERLREFLRGLVLNDQDDVLLTVGRAETPVLNAQRLATLKSTLSATGTPARVRVLQAPGFVNAETRSDVVLVQVQRYGRIKIMCPSNTLANELTTPLPPYLGCSNGANIAAMSATPRDLIAPQDFSGTEGALSTNAVIRQREDKVKPAPWSLVGGN